MTPTTHLPTHGHGLALSIRVLSLWAAILWCGPLNVLPAVADSRVAVTTAYTSGGSTRLGYSLLNPETGDFSMPTGSLVVMDLSHDGGRIAYRMGTTLRVAKVDGSEDRVVLEGLPSATTQSRVRWSPTGDRIAFLHTNGVHFVSLSGAPLGSIVDTGMVAFDWSPDGRRMAYTQVQGTNVPIPNARRDGLKAILGSIGRFKVRDLASQTTTVVHESIPTVYWLDQDFVVYTSSGPSPAYLEWAPTGEHWAVGFAFQRQLAKASGGRPLPKPAGHEDHYTALSIMDARTGGISHLVVSHGSTLGPGYPVWSPDGTEILYSGATQGLFVQDASVGVAAVPALGANTYPGRLVSSPARYPGSGAVVPVAWASTDPVQLTLATRKSRYDVGDTFTAKVTATLTRAEPHTVAFRHPPVDGEPSRVLEVSPTDRRAAVVLTPANPTEEFHLPVTALERGVATLRAAATAVDGEGTRFELNASRQVVVSPLELEIEVTPQSLVLNNTPSEHKSAGCVVLESGVPKLATNCLEIVATIRNPSTYVVRTVGIDFAEDVLTLIQSLNPTNPGVPLRLVRFLPPQGLTPDGRARRVDLAPGETAVYRWNLDAFAAPALLGIKIRATGELQGAEVVAFEEREFRLVDKALLRWGIRPAEGRTEYLSGQNVRMEGYLENVSKSTGRGRVLRVLIYQLPEGNVGGGFAVPTARMGLATADRYFVFELPFEGPSSRVEIGSLFRSFPAYEESRGTVRYGVRLWTLEDDGGVTPATDQAVLDGDWMDRFEVRFAASPPPPDGYREQCLEAGVPSMICGISHGIYFEAGEGLLGLLQFAGHSGKQLKNLGGMVASQGLFLASRMWRAAKGDEAALQALLQEAYVEYLTYVNLGVMAGEAGGRLPMAFEAFAISAVGAMDRFMRAVDEGDLTEVQFQVGRMLGANPDLLFEPLVVARNVQKLSRTLKEMAGGVTDNVIAAAERQQAERQAASLEQRLAAAAADPNVSDLASALRAGDELSDGLLASIYGISPEMRRRMQMLAKKYDIILTFRTRHPLSLSLIRDKLAWPKPQALKWKGVSQIDIDYLGYRPEALARLELMEPPPGLLGKTGPGELDDAVDAYMEALLPRLRPELADTLRDSPVLAAEVRDRLKMQVEYWEKLSPAHQLEDKVSTTTIGIDYDAGAQFTEKVGRKAGVTDTRTLTHTPVEAGVDAVTGAPRRRWELKMSGPSGGAPRYVTGDVDFLAILDRHGGLIRDDNRRIQIYHELATLMDMQHGESFTFFMQNARVEHLRCCVEGTGEAMVTIGPWGRSTPTAGYFVDNLSILDDGPNAAFLGPRPVIRGEDGLPKLKDGKPIDIRRKDPTGEFMLIRGLPTAASVRYGLIAHFIPFTIRQSLDGFLKRLPFYFPSYLARLLGGGGEPPGAAPALAASVGQRVEGRAGSAVTMFMREGGPVLQATLASGEPRLQVWTRGLGWQAVSAAEAVALGEAGVADVAPMSSIVEGAEAGRRSFGITSQEELQISGRFFEVGDEVVLNPGGDSQEYGVVQSVSPFTLVSPLAYHHDRSEVIAWVGSKVTDTDGDGLADSEERIRGTRLDDPDSDGDGLRDGHEVLVGTDPLDAGSVLRILSVLQESASRDIVVSWTSIPGRGYVLEVSEELPSGGGEWIEVARGLAEEVVSTGRLEGEFLAETRGLLFRIRLQP